MKAEPSRKVYIPIIIKTEADLPKETDDYNVLIKGKERREMQHFDITFWADKSWWFKNIDWYLLPVDLPTDEEKENAAIEGMQREEGDIIKIIDSPYACAFIDGWEAYRNKLLNR